jgi:hypothetical protein
MLKLSYGPSYAEYKKGLKLKNKIKTLKVCFFVKVFKFVILFSLISDSSSTVAAWATATGLLPRQVLLTRVRRYCTINVAL